MHYNSIYDEAEIINAYIVVKTKIECAKVPPCHAMPGDNVVVVEED